MINSQFIDNIFHTSLQIMGVSSGCTLAVDVSNIIVVVLCMSSVIVVVFQLV